MDQKQAALQFKDIRLLKDQSLGIGSYGAVYKAKCDDLLCAAKIIHPTLFYLTAQQITPHNVHRLPIRRFELECEFMSAIRHPNIVQYLGMFRDTDTQYHLPVLLMELMDDSLTHFLESSTQPIPYHIQINLCHDITLALSFLHSNNIVHRDLSGNNVVLRGNILAKVTDFGMARLDDINPRMSRISNTMVPGTDVYMPPEAVQEKPVYTEKIDCFSFGVIAVQIITRLFPQPGDRRKEIETEHMGVVEKRIPECKRRQNHISKVDPNHSLLPIALDCLKDKDYERPSAHQLCERVAGLKGMTSYIESVRTVQDKDNVIQSQAIHIEENESIASKEKENQQLRQLLKVKDQINGQLNQQLRQLQQEKDQLEERERQMNQQLKQIQQENVLALKEKTRQLQEKEVQLGRVNQQLEASEQVVAQFERRNAELEHQLSQIEHLILNPKSSSRGKELASFKLRWRKGRRAPCTMERSYDAVVDGNTVYVRRGDSVEIYSFDASKDSWFKLPDCVHGCCSIAIINGWLTAVGGGRYQSTYSNELFSLTGEGSDRRWTKKFPPMPTKRQVTSALCTGTTLIVAGGWGEDGRVLSTVELMNTENRQWSTAADLPKAMYLASATVCKDQIYMLGGDDKDHTKSTYSCSVSALLRSCVTNLPEEKLKRKYLEDRARTWTQLADLPVTRSAFQSFHDQLLAVGGKKDSQKATTDVNMYNSATNSWEVISHMTIGRYDSFTAILRNNQLMVIGGYNTKGKMIDTVEIASVH